MTVVTPTLPVGVHDHGGSADAFTVLDGRLNEQSPIGRPEVRLMARGYRVGATREATDLAGGLNAWLAAGLPTVPEPQ